MPDGNILIAIAKHHAAVAHNHIPVSCCAIYHSPDANRCIV